MCGIFFICPFEVRTHESVTFPTRCDELLCRRGPDVTKQHEIIFPFCVRGYLQGCVLHMRGNLTPQPLTDRQGNALLWNGEIFGGLQVSEEENDTQVLFDQIAKCTQDQDILNILQAVEGPWAIIYWQANTKKLWFGRDIYGRRSLLWHLPTCKSDNFILSSTATGDEVFTELSSVGIFCLDFSIPQDHVEDSLKPCLVLHPWRHCVWPGTAQLVVDTPADTLLNLLAAGQECFFAIERDSRSLLTKQIPTLNPITPGSEECTDFSNADWNIGQDGLSRVLEQMEESSIFNRLSERLLENLECAVKKRLCHCPCQTSSESFSNFSQKEKSGAKSDSSLEHERKDPPVMVSILFSGGLDSTVLAALADRCLPPEEPIDLLNVAFEQNVPKPVDPKPKQRRKKNKERTRHADCQSTSPPQAQAMDSYSAADTFAQCSPQVESAVSSNTCSAAQLDMKIVPGLQNTPSSQDILKDLPVNGGSSTRAEKESPTVLSSSWQTPLIKISQSEEQVCSRYTERNSSLTKPSQSEQQICDRYREKNNSTLVEMKDGSSNLSELANKPHLSEAASHDAFGVPDRLTGRAALAELNPHRKWNFVEINVTQTELREARESHICRLISPLQTVLDDSIGCAVWFAARGLGQLPNGQSYHSQARVLLCGMGADEQLAGYSRHRVTFNKAGWPGLVAELKEEMCRISTRNLGRDDRIISDHGKEARFPYLDENFTQFLSGIPVHHKANLHLPRGLGEKLLLRVAALKLGLLTTAVQPKRAIQFGSKIAKLDNKHEKGSDVCSRLS